jgi:putative AdoMet-dependent methyltransferase
VQNLCNTIGDDLDGENKERQEELREGFDVWAHTYDRDVQTSTNSFPFAGYPEALATVWQQAEAAPGMSVLDLGVGTGNLSKLFMESGCQVLGVDFSSEMLSKTREKLPQLELVEADLTAEEWPPALGRRFERIVSNYLFHEFPFEMKLRILSRLAGNILAPNGRIVIGDITFPSTADLNRVRMERPDEWEEEFYWTVEKTREVLEAAGWGVAYSQISFCAGVYVFTPPDNLADVGNVPYLRILP